MIAENIAEKDQTEFVSREDELETLQGIFDKVMDGRGSTVLVHGEAGVGKTRFVEEAILRIEEQNDVLVVRGHCLAESKTPLMFIREAFRKSDIYHLISENPPPKVVSTYLIDDSGLLLVKSEREESGLDPDIFASMLSAVENFVNDSLSLMQKKSKGGLSGITYKDYNIILQTHGKLSIAMVIQGEKSEFLINDINKTLYRIGNKFDNWKGKTAATKELEPLVSWFIESGKYDGKYLLEDPEIKKENLFDNVLYGIQRLSETNPIIIFIDDLQWADPSSLTLLHYLSRNTQDSRVLLMGTYRPEDLINTETDDPHPLKKVMQNMGREKLYQDIEIDRLPKEANLEIIRSYLGEMNLPSELIHRIHKEAEGNPFFTIEIIQMLIEEGVLEDVNGEWVSLRSQEDIHIPSRVYDVVLRRLNRLLEGQYDILECASVIGNEFESRVIQETIQMNRIILLKNLNSLEKSHKLIHSVDGKYRFDHTKVKDVLYSRINEELREEYHRMVAESYENIYADKMEEVIEKLAYQYYMAEDERCVEYLITTGDRYKEKFANQEAVHFYQMALEHLEEDEEIVDTKMKMAEIYDIMGEYDKTLENYENLLEMVEESRTRADIYRKISEVYYKLDERKKTEKAIELGLKEVEGEKCIEEVKLRSSLGWLTLKNADYKTAHSIMFQVLEDVKELDDKKELGQTLHRIGTIYWYKGDLDEALEYLKQAKEVRESIGDIQGASDTTNNIAIVYHDLGKIKEAEENYLEMMENEQKIGDNYGIALAYNNIGNLHLDKGEVEKGLEYYDKSYEISKRIGGEEACADVINNMGLIYHSRGEYQKALEHYKKCLDIWIENDDKYSMVIVLNNMGEVYRDLGQEDRALDNALRSLDICNKIGMKTHYVSNYECLTKLSLDKEDYVDAYRYAQKALKVAEEIGAKTQIALSHRLLGMCHREMDEKDKAEESFDRSSEIFSEVGDKRELAKTKYEYARLLEDTEPEKAANRMEEAMELFQDMGMSVWVERCEDELDDIGR